MIAVVVARNWHASWWEWHLLMAAAFGYVGYSAFARYRREGAATGLFDAVGGEHTLRRGRGEEGGPPGGPGGRVGPPRGGGVRRRGGGVGEGGPGPPGWPPPR